MPADEQVADSALSPMQNLMSHQNAASIYHSELLYLNLIFYFEGKIHFRFVHICMEEVLSKEKCMEKLNLRYWLRRPVQVDLVAVNSMNASADLAD